MQPRLAPLSWVSLGLLAVFGVYMGLAVWYYPGGSWLHPQANGHAFFENFWCDLLRQPAHNGRANQPGAAFAALGFVSLALSLAAFWSTVAQRFSGFRRNFVRYAGIVSALGTALVAALPSDRAPTLHAPMVLLAGGLGFACGALTAASALREFQSAPAFAVTSLGLIATAGLNLALYVWVAYFGGPNTALLPTVQKLATLSLVSWMMTGLSAHRPRP